MIVVQGEELLRYFSDQDRTGPMPVELQAEIDFGLRASGSSYSNVVALSESALLQDEAWREDGESALAEGRRLARRNPLPVASELASSAANEVAAWKAAWLADWETAGKAAVTVLEGLTSPATRPYRALWAYLASAWFARSAGDGNTAGPQRAADLLKKAHEAAAGTTWLREVQPLPAGSAVVEPADESAIDKIITQLNGPFKSSVKFSGRVQTMLNRLARVEAKPYEQALVDLGLFLGADSFKPSGQGRADAVWLWSEL